MSKENRLQPRKRRRLSVSVGDRKAFTCDISPGGFCVETMFTQAPGTDVTGSLELEAGPVPFTGKVAWVFHGDLRAHQRGRMGVRLTGIAGDYYQLFL